MSPAEIEPGGFFPELASHASPATLSPYISSLSTSTDSSVPQSLAAPPASSHLVDTSLPTMTDHSRSPPFKKPMLAHADDSGDFSQSLSHVLPADLNSSFVEGALAPRAVGVSSASVEDLPSLTPGQQHAPDPSSIMLQSPSSPVPARHLATAGPSASLAPGSSDSSASTTVILVEPVADLHPVSRFFSNSLQLSKTLAKSPFGVSGIERIHKNLNRGLLVITLQSPLRSPLSELLSVTQLGSWKVRCRLPQNRSLTVGVIGPVGEDTTDEEITSALVASGHVGAVASRILKGKDKHQTSTVKITFTASSLPSHVYLGYERFKVSLFIGNPWQCFRCQRFGHNAQHCTFSVRCVACGGPHQVKDCPGVTSATCSNCGGAHTANYGGCPNMRQAKVVEKVRAHQQLSYRDAVRVVKASAAPVVPPAVCSLPPAPAVCSLAATGPAPARRGTACSVSTQTSPPLTLQDTTTATQLVVLLSRVLSFCTPVSPSATLAHVAKVTSEVLGVAIPLHTLPQLSSATQSCSPAPASASGDAMDTVPPESSLSDLDFSSCTFPSVSLLPPSACEERVFDPSPILGGHYLHPHAALQSSGVAVAAPAAASAAAPAGPGAAAAPAVADAPAIATTTAPAPTAGSALPTTTSAAASSLAASAASGPSQPAKGTTFGRGRPFLSAKQGSRRKGSQCQQPKT